MAAATKPDETNVPKVCHICFEEAEHTVTECQHTFCEACFQSHLKASDSTEAFLVCPTCHCDDCSKPEGPGTLPDFVPAEAKNTADDELEVKAGDDDAQHNTNDVENEETTEVPQKDCTVCGLKDEHATSCAKRFCEECDVFLCERCSDAHGQKQGTKTHILSVIGAATRSSAGFCRQHDNRPLKMYCPPCAIPCCGLCVENNHGDHDVCPIKNVLDAAIFRLENVMEQGKSRVNDLDMKESAVFSTRKAKLEWKKSVIRTVEEKAGVCVNNILEQKAKLLKTIREGCETSGEDEYLRDVARVRGEISARVDEGDRLLSSTHGQADPKYLKRLSKIEADIERELVSQANILREVDVDCTRPISFLEERDPVTSIGSMSMNALLKATKLYDLQMPSEMEFTSIPEIRCLGDRGYAAICRQEAEEFPDQLVIFDKDGKLRNVEKDLPVVSGMDVDAQDRVVLLLPSKKDDFFLIRVYNTENGTSESTKEFLLPKPLSMAVSPECFYILSEGPECNRIISAVDTKGNITESASIAYPVGIMNHTRIACSWQYIYTMGLSMIATFRMIDGRITLLDTIKHNDLNQLRDISTTVFDETFVIQYDGNPVATPGQSTLFGKMPTSTKSTKSTTPLFGVTAVPAFMQGSVPQATINYTYHHTSLLARSLTYKTREVRHIVGVEADGSRIHVQSHILMWTNNKEIFVYKLHAV